MALLQKWDAVDDTPRGTGKQIISVHRAKFQQSKYYYIIKRINSDLPRVSGPPTQAKARQKLIQEEYVREIAGFSQIGEASLVATGINLEQDQYVYQ